MPWNVEIDHSRNVEKIGNCALLGAPRKKRGWSEDQPLLDSSHDRCGPMAYWYLMTNLPPSFLIEMIVTEGVMVRNPPVPVVGRSAVTVLVDSDRVTPVT